MHGREGASAEFSSKHRVSITPDYHIQQTIQNNQASSRHRATMISVRCSLAQSTTMHVVASERINVSSTKPRNAFSIILKTQVGCRCATARAMGTEAVATSTSPSSCRDVGQILTSAAALIGNTPMVSNHLLLCTRMDCCNHALHLECTSAIMLCL